MLVGVVRDHGVDGTVRAGVSLMLELNVGLFLVLELLVVRVSDQGDLVVHGCVVDNARSVMLPSVGVTVVAVAVAMAISVAVVAVAMAVSVTIAMSVVAVAMSIDSISLLLLGLVVVIVVVDGGNNSGVVDWGNIAVVAVGGVDGVGLLLLGFVVIVVVVHWSNDGGVVDWSDIAVTIDDGIILLLLGLVVLVVVVDGADDSGVVRSNVSVVAVGGVESICLLLLGLVVFVIVVDGGDNGSVVDWSDVSMAIDDGIILLLLGLVVLVVVVDRGDNSSVVDWCDVSMAVDDSIVLLLLGLVVLVIVVDGGDNGSVVDWCDVSMAVDDSIVLLISLNVVAIVMDWSDYSVVRSDIAMTIDNGIILLLLSLVIIVVVIDRSDNGGVVDRCNVPMAIDDGIVLLLLLSLVVVVIVDNRGDKGSVVRSHIGSAVAIDDGIVLLFLLGLVVIIVVIDWCHNGMMRGDVAMSIDDSIILLLLGFVVIIIVIHWGHDGVVDRGDICSTVTVDDGILLLLLGLVVVVVVIDGGDHSVVRGDVSMTIDDGIVLLLLLGLVVIVVVDDRGDKGGVVRSHIGSAVAVDDGIVLLFLLGLVIVVIVDNWCDHSVVRSHIGSAVAVDNGIVLLLLGLVVIVVVDNWSDKGGVVRCNIGTVAIGVDGVSLIFLGLVVFVVVIGSDDGVVRSDIGAVAVSGGVDWVSLLLLLVLVPVVTTSVVRVGSGVVRVGMVGAHVSVDSVRLLLCLVWHEVGGDVVLHLASKEDLGKGKTDRVTELVEVLVLPLSLGVHDLVVDILAVHNEVVLNMENEVPWVGESLGHLAELVKICADGGLALLELVGDVVDNMTKILNGVKDRVEGGVLELINDTAEALPNVLGITEALNTVRDLSLNRASEHTLENLTHAEESEVDVGGLHGLEVVHLLVLLVVDLVKKLLPVVVEVEEKFLVVDHLGLSVKEHGSGLAEVLTGVNPLAHAVVVETLAGILKHIHTVNDERLVGFEEDLLGVEEGLGHSLDLLVVVVVNLTAVVKHVTDVGDGETELVNGLGCLLERSIPEAAHGVLEVLLNWVGIADAVGNVCHAMEVEGTDEESLNEAGDLNVVVKVLSDRHSGNECSSKSGLEHCSESFSD